jgi:uncharacterized protein YecT (DUF1311 family)
MPRDKILELLSKRERADEYKLRPSYFDVQTLESLWKSRLRGMDTVDELIPIKIVTMLEVFVRNWIELLIDHGAPYVERASKIRVDLKYDFAIAKSLQGGTVTIGQLIAHSVALSRIEMIAAVLETLLDGDLFEIIAKTRDLWKVKHQGDSVGPIVDDVEKLRRRLARVFEVRHIVVHEVTREKPYKLEEIDEFLTAASIFMEATDEELRTRIYGSERRTQTEMNREAASLHQSAMAELNSLCAEVVKDTPEIYDVQKLWLSFKEAEAERQTERHLGGTIRPMIYSLSAEGLTRTRIRELRDWLDRRV